MKLNYRDKVILGIFLAAMILIGAFFALIKPKNDEIKAEKKTLAAEEEKEDEIRAKIKQISTLEDTITEIVDNTNDITKHFVEKDEVKNTVLLDEFMMHFANDNKIRITNLAVSDMSEYALNYYFINQQDIGSGLRELADFTGEYQKETDDELAEQNQLTDRETPSVLKTEYAFEAECTKENLWKLMDALENYDDAILITNMSYEKLLDEELAKKPEEEMTFEEKNIAEDDDVKVTMKVSLYSVYDLKKPDYKEAE
ncbi:MAG: hypothetical protein IJ487_00485 [Ruminococcus sp.]|nr:hypothetical protein [Ruminococcus sp.]